jgi:hypothetical protein
MDAGGPTHGDGGDELAVLWSVLEQSGAAPGATAQVVIDRAYEILLDRGADAAVLFLRGLHGALYELDRESLFAQPIRDRGEDLSSPPIPLSDDTFLYARCAVLTSGRAVYESVLQDPRSFAATWDLDAESLLELPERALAELGADPLDPEPLPSYETGSNREHWSVPVEGTRPSRLPSNVGVSWVGGSGQHPALIVDSARLDPIAVAVAAEVGSPGGALDRWLRDRGLRGVAVELMVPLDWHDRSTDRVQVHDGKLVVPVHLEQADLELADADLSAAAVRRVTARLSDVARRRRWPAIDW